MGDGEGGRLIWILLSAIGLYDTADLQPGVVLDRLRHAREMYQDIAGIGNTAGDDHASQIGLGGGATARITIGWTEFARWAEGQE